MLGLCSLFFMVFFHIVFSKIDEGTLDNTKIQEFLDAHNYFRRLEKASNMNVMRWDKTLALMALKWAQKCLFKHGQPPSPASPYSYTGQNIYVRSPPLNPNLTRVTELWYNEKVNYTYETQTCKGDCGHYTQVVWADTNYVGCAIYNCTTMPPLKAKYITTVICNYGPGGNFPGMDPYVVGVPCEMCSSDVCLDGLCDFDYWN